MSNTDRLERDEDTVRQFHDLMLDRCRPAGAIERSAGATYTQHDPHVGDGTTAFVDVERMARGFPGEEVRFRRAIAEDDLVVLHCHQSRPGDHDHAGIDVFGLDPDGEVVEHWDVLPVVPHHSANDNGMF